MDRRRLLRRVAAGGMMGLAGCTGGGGGADGGGDGGGDEGGETTTTAETTTTSGGVEMVDRAWSSMMGRTPPPDLQYNPLNPKNYGGVVGDLAYSHLLQFSTVTNEFRHDLINDISISGDGMTIDLKEYTWHNGDPVTAEDVVTRLRLEKHVGGSTWNYLESVSVGGDRTVEGSFSTSVNKDVFQMLLSQIQVSTPKSRFGDMLQAIEDATSESAKKDAKSKLTSYAPSEPLGSGPFKFDSADGQGVTLTKHDAHPMSDNLNFPRVRLKYVGETDQQRWAATRSSNVDHGGAGTPTDVIKSFPDHFMIVRNRRYGDITLQFNLNHKWLAKRKVRQALAYVTNRKQAVGNQGQPDKIHMEKPVSGMFGSEKYQKQWIGDLNGKLTRYTPGSEGQTKAKSLLEDEGFSKQKDTWMTPDGKPFSLTYIAPACCNAWQTMVQTAANNAQDFGIKAEFTAVNTSNFFASKQPNGDYEVGTTLPGGFPHPFFAYQGWFPAVDGKAWAGTETGYPDKPEVPMPIGDPDGSLKKVSWREPFNTLGSTAGEKAKQAVRKLAWIFNQSLPGYPIADKAGPAWINTQGWSVPDEDQPRNDLLEVQKVTDPDLKVASSWLGIWLLHKGKIQADPDESLPG